MTTPAAAATAGRRFRPGPSQTGVPDEANIISRYALDGGAVTDALGGVNGTITGTWTSTATASLVSGVSGQSFFKNGNSAYFTIPADNPLHNLGALSFSLYFQPTSDAAHSTICARANSTTIGGFSLERRSTGLLRGWHVGSDGGLRFFGSDPNGIAGTNLVVGTAYRITVTMGPGGLKIYLDDNLVDHIPQNVNGWNNTFPWFFGVFTNAVGLPMRGIIDHIRVWTGELQASAVAGLEPATSISTPGTETLIFQSDEADYSVGTASPTIFANWGTVVSDFNPGRHTIQLDPAGGGGKCYRLEYPQGGSGAVAAREFVVPFNSGQDMVNLALEFELYMPLPFPSNSADALKFARIAGHTFNNAAQRTVVDDPSASFSWDKLTGAGVANSVFSYCYYVNQSSSFGTHFPSGHSITGDTWTHYRIEVRGGSGSANGSHRFYVNGALVQEATALQWHTTAGFGWRHISLTLDALYADEAYFAYARNIKIYALLS